MWLKCGAHPNVGTGSLLALAGQRAVNVDEGAGEEEVMIHSSIRVARESWVGIALESRQVKIDLI